MWFLWAIFPLALCVFPCTNSPINVIPLGNFFACTLHCSWYKNYPVNVKFALLIFLWISAFLVQKLPNECEIRLAYFPLNHYVLSTKITQRIWNSSCLFSFESLCFGYKIYPVNVKFVLLLFPWISAFLVQKLPSECEICLTYLFSFESLCSWYKKFTRLMWNFPCLFFPWNFAFLVQKNHPTFSALWADPTNIFF